MQNLIDRIKKVRKSLAVIAKNRRYHKENLAIEEKAELSAALAQCSGELEVSKMEFSRIIHKQVRFIREGEEQHADTKLQQEMLRSATIGYMLVKDAQYALRSITTFDSLHYANTMLDTAIDLMTDKKRSVPSMRKTGRLTERDDYGYITSAKALKDKETAAIEVVKGLLAGCDIEDCIAQYYNKNGRSSGDSRKDTSLEEELFGKIPSTGSHDVELSAEEFKELANPYN